MAATNIFSERKKFWLLPSCLWPHPQASAVSATDPPLRGPWVVKQLHFPLLCLFRANLKITAALNLCSPKFNKVQEIGRLWDSISESVLLSLCQQPRWSKKTQRRGEGRQERITQETQKVQIQLSVVLLFLPEISKKTKNVPPPQAEWKMWVQSLHCREKRLCLLMNLGSLDCTPLSLCCPLSLQL